MNWEKATEIVDKIRSLERDEAINIILELANKDEAAEPYPSPLTSSDNMAQALPAEPV
ncbi:MAG: hypothetical protein HQ591_12490 [candidate division Zixibacteria bacterium]|nr:hypothetical protein [Candidatus Tariuqbacter arcticus]